MTSDHAAPPAWASRARPVEHPVLDVTFYVPGDYYYGPENDFDEHTWRTLREPLHRPALPGHAGREDHVSAPAPESVGELAKYYADVLRIAAKHGQVPPCSHFWLSPVLYAPGALDIPFAWHDTQDDAERLFSALETPGDGLLFDDLHQGWELEIFASGDRLYIRHGDGDGADIDLVCCHRAALVAQVAPLRARLERILAELRATFGTDYWSRPPLPAWR